MAQQDAFADTQLQRLGSSRVRRSSQFSTASKIMKSKRTFRNLVNHNRLQRLPAFLVAALAVVCISLAAAAAFHIAAFQCNHEHVKIRASRSTPQQDDAQQIQSWNYQGKIDAV